MEEAGVINHSALARDASKQQINVLKIDKVHSQATDSSLGCFFA